MAQFDPTKITELSTEELCEQYENLKFQVEELDAEQKVLRDEIYSRMKEDAEVHGDFGVTKVEKLSWNAVKVEQAKEFGAVKEAVDTTKLTKLYKAGAKLPFTPSVISYPLIKRVDQPEGTEE